MDRQTQQRLNELSKKVFGASSRWRKLVEKGVVEPVSSYKEVMIPNRNGTVSKKVFKDNKCVLHRYSVVEVEKLMNDMAEGPNKAKDAGAEDKALVDQVVKGGL